MFVMIGGKLFYNKFKEFEVDRIKKVNLLVEELTGLPLTLFLYRLYTVESLSLLMGAYFSCLSDNVVSFLLSRFYDNQEDWNSRRDWRKLDVFIRSLINGWVIEDATYYNLINNGVNVVLNELPRLLNSRHAFEPDLIVNGVPIEVATHFYNFIQDEGVWLVKKYKFDYMKKVNGLFLVYDLYEKPRFMIVNPSSVNVIEKKKLIGGKRGYVVSVNPDDLYSVGKLSEIMLNLTNEHQFY